MTLPGEYYASERVFQLERRRIFHRHWFYAGHVSQLPETGSFFLTAIDRESVIVVRDDEGGVSAHHNVCRHRGCRIAGETSGRFAHRIQCPYHAWTYGFDGTLVGAPNMHEVSGFERAEYPLKPVAVAVWEGFIFLNLSADPAPLSSLLAPLDERARPYRLAELRSVHQTVYEVDANWKLLFQNYSECYHCPAVHPLLNDLTPFRNSSNDLDEGPILGGPMTLARPGGSMSINGERCAPPLGSIAGGDLDRVYYYTLMPNMFLSLHPDYVLVHRAEPLAVDRTRVHCDWFFDPEAASSPGFDPAGAIEFWDLTNRQDWQLCTISQQGISSDAYSPGPYSELESQLAAFDREYLRLLGDVA